MAETIFYAMLFQNNMAKKMAPITCCAVPLKRLDCVVRTGAKKWYHLQFPVFENQQHHSIVGHSALAERREKNK